MKVTEAKFCIEPSCEQVAHVNDSQCVCGCTQFILLGPIVNPALAAELRELLRKAVEKKAVVH